MGKDETFLKQTFGIREGTKTRIPLPGADRALKMSARRKQKLSKQDRAEVLALASLGKEAEQIADQKNFALFLVRKVIAESKNSNS